MRIEDPGLILPRVGRLRFLSAADSRITGTIQVIYLGFSPCLLAIV